MSNEIYYPLSTRLVSEWPGDRGGWYHYGTDFAVPVNTPLVASFDGTVVFAGGDGASGQINGVWANGEGLTVDIIRPDGLRARYGHMNSIAVRLGQHVKAGQYIGMSGNTGYTTGPHCHWELRWDAAWSGGAWADPRKLGAKEISTLNQGTKLPKKGTKMFMTYYDNAGGPGKRHWAVFGPNFWLEIVTQKAANDLAKQLGFSAFKTDKGGWDKYKRVSGG